MGEIDTTGRALVDHWKWAAQKGLLKENTARTWQAACSQVLSALDGWESVDVRTIDVDDVSRRFVNKRSKDFKPDSLDTYKRRFASAVREFIAFADDPSSWRPLSKERAVRRSKAVSPRRQSRSSEAEGKSGEAHGIGTLIDYPCPLGGGRFALLRLPSDFSTVDLKRLTTYLSVLIVDAD